MITWQHHASKDITRKNRRVVTTTMKRTRTRSNNHHGGPFPCYRSQLQAAVFLVFFGVPRVVLSLLPANGNCMLDILLPFTVNSDLSGQSPPMSTALFTKSRIYSLGYIQMGAALMAMEDFNARNGHVIPELPALTAGCNVEFDINNTMFVDTGVFGMTGNNNMFDLAEQRGQTLMCAIAGPYFEVPAENTAMLAAAIEVPHVPHRAYGVRLSAPRLSPVTTNMSPDIIILTQAVSAYLLHIQRTNFIAVLHPITDYGIQTGLALGIAFNARGIDQWHDYAFIPRLFAETIKLDRKIPHVMKLVKQRGFRTIVVAFDTFVDDLTALANAAEELGMLNGDYVWIFMPIFERATIHNLIQLPESLLASQGIPSFANVTKLLRGATLITDIADYEYKKETDPFWRAWKQQNEEFVERVNQAYRNRTVQKGPEGMLMPPEFFQRFEPEQGTGNLYDTIMAIGIGACKAQRDNETGVINSYAHTAGIRNVSFTGATGNVKFGDRVSNQTKSQTRRADTITFGVYNMYPPSKSTNLSDATSELDYDEAFVLTELLTEIEGPYAPSAGKWTQYGPIFVFANGQVQPPELLRDIPEQNYLPPPFRIAGLVLMSFSLLCCVMSLLFVGLRWNHRIIRASQPYFLCLLVFGAMTTSTAIFTISNDESYDWDETALSRACMATPWLFCTGHSITYGALFSKLWRVNRVLQFSRRKISATAVAGPMVALLVATVVVLTARTLYDPLSWVRVEVNGISGESIGRCDSDAMPIFAPLLAVFVFVPTLLTCIMAWKTKDVDEAFTESAWIFTLILLQIQVILVAIPVVVLLRDVSTEGRYMGLVILIWTFPMSAVILIMGPKFLAYFRATGTSVSSNSRPANSRGPSERTGRVQNPGFVSGLSGESSGAKDHNSEMGSAFVSGASQLDNNKNNNNI